MIPAIGLMIAAYIVTRMVELMTRENQPLQYWFVRGLALITVLITGFISVYLFLGDLPGFP